MVRSEGAAAEQSKADMFSIEDQGSNNPIAVQSSLLHHHPPHGLAAGMSKLAPGAEEKMTEMVVASIQIGRMGRKWDIAMAAVFLASSAAT